MVFFFYLKGFLDEYVPPVFFFSKVVHEHLSVGVFHKLGRSGLHICLCSVWVLGEVSPLLFFSPGIGTGISGSIQVYCLPIQKMNITYY